MIARTNAIRATNAADLVIADNRLHLLDTIDGRATISLAADDVLVERNTLLLLPFVDPTPDEPEEPSDDPTTNPADPCARPEILYLHPDIVLQYAVGVWRFLVAQLLYTVGFALTGGEATDYVIGAVVAAIIVTPLAIRFVRALRAASLDALVPPLVAYMAAISAMLVSAIGSGNPYAIVGALLFTASDALIAETRFVRARQDGERGIAGLAIMVTYYLAQAGLVLSLV